MNSNNFYLTNLHGHGACTLAQRALRLMGVYYEGVTVAVLLQLYVVVKKHRPCQVLKFSRSVPTPLLRPYLQDIEYPNAGEQVMVVLVNLHAPSIHQGELQRSVPLLSRGF